MAGTAVMSPTSPTRGTFDVLDADVLERVFINCKPRDVFAARLSTTTCYAAATSTPVWKIFLEEMVGGPEDERAAVPEGKSAMRHYFDVEISMKENEASALAEQLVAFKSCEYAALRQYGEVLDAGEATARFEPSKPIELPVPAVVVLELVRLYSTALVSKDDRKHVDKFKKAAEALGVNRTSVRHLATNLPKRPLAQAQALGALFPDAQKSAAAKAGPSGPAAAAAPIGRAAPRDERRYANKRAFRALERENSELREENALLRRRLDEQGNDLRLAHAEIDRLRQAHGREVLRLTRKLTALHAEGTSKDEVHARELKRVNDKLEKERARVRGEEQRAADLRKARAASRDAKNESARLRSELAAKDADVARHVKAMEALQLSAAATQERLQVELALERRNVADLERATVTTRRQAAADFKREYWAETLEQQKAGVLSPTKRAVAASVLSSVAKGVAIHLPQPNLHRRGPGFTALRVTHAEKDTAALVARQRLRRVQEVTSSKCFCIWCLARLHETNAAGVPHGVTPQARGDKRAPHIAHPPLRGGSLAVQRRVQAYRMAEYRWKADKTAHKKPEPADYYSCIEPPLIWSSEQILTLATTPLHFMLGIGLELINKIEFELKQFDFAHTVRVGRKPEDAELAVKVAAAADALDALQKELEAAELDQQHHLNSMEVIKATKNSAEAVARGMKNNRSKKQLPLEAEFRAHREAERKAEIKINNLGGQIEKAEHALIKLWSGDRGPFEESFFQLMSNFNFKRQAYHSAALNGDDIHRAMKPKAIKAFSDLLRPRVGCCTVVKPGGEVGVELFHSGSDARADDYLDLFSLYGEAMSLHGRIEPLCVHEIERFGYLARRMAIKYATMFPTSEPGPKLHGFLAHALTQMRMLGSTGFLSESVVESIHVLDNAMQRRNACIRDPEVQLRCRARSIWELQCPLFMSVRDPEDVRADKKRRKTNLEARKYRYEVGQQIETCVSV